MIHLQLLWKSSIRSPRMHVISSSVDRQPPSNHANQERFQKKILYIYIHPICVRDILHKSFEGVCPSTICLPLRKQ